MAKIKDDIYGCWLDLLLFEDKHNPENKTKGKPTTFFLSSEEEGLRSLCSEGDLGGFLPGEPRVEGGLVEGFGEGSGPAETRSTKLKVYSEVGD